MSFDQGTFDFTAAGSETGYARWQERLDAERRAFEKRWGVVLNRRVSLKLSSFDKPLVGIVSIRKRPRHGSSRPLLLRINNVEFTPAEIESVVRLDSDAA